MSHTSFARKGVLLAAIMLLWSTGLRAAEILRAAYEDQELAPYYLGNSAAIPAQPGVSIELMRTAAKEAGVDIQFVRMPWVRCLKSLQVGDVDVIFNASYKPERQENGLYPMTDGKPDHGRRITTVSYALYRLKGSAVGWDGKAFSGLQGPIGAPSGYSILGDLKAMGIATEDAPDTLTNFKKLASGRIPAVATLDTSGDALLASGDFPNVEKAKLPLVTKDYFAMFSHQFYGGKRDLAERFWRKLAEVRDRDGDKLMAKYAK